MKCVYPGCRASVDTENGVCADHAEATCLYPLHEPRCQGRPIAHSGYCAEHDVVASFFILLHAGLHQQAAETQARVREQEAIIKRVGLPFSGKGLRLTNGH